MEQFENLHEAAKLVVDFASAMIPARPFYDYQEEFASALVVAVVECDPTELTALFARQSGKTETVARILATLVLLMPSLVQVFPELNIYKLGFWVGVFAPITSQADTTFSRVVEVMDGVPFQALMMELGITTIKKNMKERKFSNGSFICIRSASKNSNIEGLTLHIALIEEAQDVGTNKIRKSIEPMLTATQGTIVQIGTANTIRSAFFESIQKNELKDMRNPGGKKTHFQFDWRVVAMRSPAYYRSLDKKFTDHGIGLLETDAFKMAYGCEFILERGQFITPEKFNEIAQKSRHIGIARYTYGRYQTKYRCYAGIDWGKSSDSTVITIIEKREDHLRIVAWLQLQGDDYESQKESIIKFLKPFTDCLELILAESNSMGAPMVDWLKKLRADEKLKCSVEAFYTLESNKSDGYIKLALSMVGKKSLLFPADETAVKSREYQAFQTQFIKLEKNWKGSLMKVAAPEEADAHDDYPMSTMIAHWAASQVTSKELWELFDGKA